MQAAVAPPPVPMVKSNTTMAVQRSEALQILSTMTRSTMLVSVQVPRGGFSRLNNLQTKAEKSPLLLLGITEPRHRLFLSARRAAQVLALHLHPRKLAKLK